MGKCDFFDRNQGHFISVNKNLLSRNFACVIKVFTIQAKVDNPLYTYYNYLFLNKIFNVT